MAKNFESKFVKTFTHTNIQAEFHSSIFYFSPNKQMSAITICCALNIFVRTLSAVLSLVFSDVNRTKDLNFRVQRI